VFWCVQGVVAASALAAFASLGGACRGSATTSGTGTHDTRSTTAPGTLNETVTDSCTDYGRNETETCAGACSAYLASTAGNNLCIQGGGVGPLSALLACAKGKCATECPKFIACYAEYGVLDDANCTACLQGQCPQEWASCDAN
jgi:hypothetical protein